MHLERSTSHHWRDVAFEGVLGHCTANVPVDNESGSTQHGRHQGAIVSSFLVGAYNEK
jgi:hypothetical protein